MSQRAVLLIALGIAGFAIQAAILRADLGVEQRVMETYCEDVAVWMAEEARGIAPEHRTGHPDYDGIAAEQCPGLRPAR